MSILIFGMSRSGSPRIGTRHLSVCCCINVHGSSNSTKSRMRVVRDTVHECINLHVRISSYLFSETVKRETLAVKHQ